MFVRRYRGKPKIGGITLRELLEYQYKRQYENANLNFK
jgi:hypothetical protein